MPRPWEVTAGAEERGERPWFSPRKRRIATPSGGLLLGIAFSLLSAAFFALNATAARRAVLFGSVLMGLAITVPLGVPLFYLLALLTGEGHLVFGLPPEAVAWFSAAGIIHFVCGRYCNYSAAGAIGTNLSAPIMQSEVLVTLVLAIVVLGEYLTPLRILGIALLIIGPSLVINRDGANVAKSGFQPRYLEGYTMATLAAVA
ncbi:MAG: EamA family transporter [Hyphomicrobiaceae bacterium]